MPTTIVSPHMRVLAILMFTLGLEGCAPLVAPQRTWGSDRLSGRFPAGSNGRELEKELVSRGFLLSTDLRAPHHDASYMFAEI